MQRMRFMVLTGHLNEYTLIDLLGILHHQRKTGRLLVEYPKAPAIFYFQDGKLIGAQVGTLSGLQALYVALSLPPVPFNFNPLIQPPTLAADDSLQKVLLEILGLSEEGDWLDAQAVIDSTPTPITQPLSAAPAPHTISAPPRLTETSRALPPASSNEALLTAATSKPNLVLAPHQPRRSNTRVVVAFAGALAFAALILLFGKSTVSPPSAPPPIADKPTPAAPEAKSSDVAPAVVEPTASASVPSNNAAPPRESNTAQRREAHSIREPSKTEKNASDSNKEGATTAASATPKGSTAAETSAVAETAQKVGSSKKPANDASRYQPVTVVMQIENGRVVQATVANHRPGMEGFESLALRLARQRRYSEKTSGQEKLQIKVTPQP